MPTIVDTKTATGGADDDNNRKMRTAKEVGDRLHFSPRKVHDLALSGELRGYKIAGEWRFYDVDVDDFIERHLWKHEQR
jgi:hypothetical protein